MGTTTTPAPTTAYYNLFDGDEITVRVEDGKFVIVNRHGTGTVPGDVLQVTACGDRQAWRAARGF